MTDPVPPSSEAMPKPPGVPGSSPSAVGDADEPGVVRIPRWAAVLVSGLAAGIIAVHLAVPSLRIDAATLVLLGVAVLPWAGPLIKAARFGPFELNQLRIQSERLHQAVTEVNARVEEIRRLVITGATPDQQARLETDLARYRGYLSRIGVDVDQDEPPIRVVHDPGQMSNGMLSEYRDGAIYILADYADRPTVALREYTHHALRVTERTPEIQDAPGRLIESGLAYYLPCSFANDPRFGGVARPQGGDVDESYLDDISVPDAESQEASALDRYVVGGHNWAVKAWGLRKKIGPAVTDPALVAAWFAADMNSTDNPEGAFVVAVRNRLPSDQAEFVFDLLTGVQPT